MFRIPLIVNSEKNHLWFSSDLRLEIFFSDFWHLSITVSWYYSMDTTKKRGRSLRDHPYKNGDLSTTAAAPILIWDFPPFFLSSINHIKVSPPQVPIFSVAYCRAFTFQISDFCNVTFAIIVLFSHNSGNCAEKRNKQKSLLDCVNQEYDKLFECLDFIKNII